MNLYRKNVEKGKTFLLFSEGGVVRELIPDNQSNDDINLSNKTNKIKIITLAAELSSDHCWSKSGDDNCALRWWRWQTGGVWSSDVRGDRMNFGMNNVEWSVGENVLICNSIDGVNQSHYLVI